VPLTLAEALKQTQKLYNELQNRRPAITRADEYYHGKQPLRFASDAWREYHAARYERFADNWCAPVANSPQERLRVDGFQLDDDPAVSDAEQELWDAWLLNDMESQSSQGFLGSIVGGRSFVLVWGTEDEEPVATWERGDQAIVWYDPERLNRRVAALKTWCDEDDEYATLYTEDEVWKFERDKLAIRSYGNTDISGNPRAVEYFARTSGLVVPLTDGGTWKLRDDADPNPMRNPLGIVPMVEFPNRPTLGGIPVSDIAGTMAMQDAINLLWAYLFTAADFASMPARVVMGQEPPKIPILDETGNKVGEKVVDMKKIAEDRVLWLTGQNTKIAQWDAAKLDVFTSTIEVGVTHIAAQTRTPPHYLVLGKGMVNVNAEGMKAAETGLVMKVQEEQLFFTPSTREVFRLFALVKDDKALAKQCRRGVVKWKNAENRSEAQSVDAALKLHSMSFPFPWVCEYLGLSPTEIDRIEAMRETERANAPAVQIANAMSGANVPAAKMPKMPGPAGAAA
jgi:hypothetical protein